MLSVICILMILSKMLKETARVMESSLFNNSFHLKRSSNGICCFLQIKIKTSWPILLSQNGNNLAFYLKIGSFLWHVQEMSIKSPEMRQHWLKTFEVSTNRQIQECFCMPIMQTQPLPRLLLVVRTDTNVFMLLLSKVCHMDTEVYMMKGTDQNRRLININAVAIDIYDNISKTYFAKKSLVKAPQGFHCFTGCDIISAFAGWAKWKPIGSK